MFAPVNAASVQDPAESLIVVSYIHRHVLPSSSIL
jgi:hypothetical protein